MLTFLRNQVDYHMSNLQKHREIRYLQQSSSDEYHPAAATTLSLAGFYVLSGVTQPLIMALAKDSGLADKTCQLYMLFYYLGPASVIFFLQEWPSQKAIHKATCIAVFDVVAQALNYTGSAMAGPTIFAIIYSSVTVWTAVFSRICLSRQLTPWQWLGVVIVFVGLAITGLHSVSMGREVFQGSCLVTVGSIMHALTYVMSEAIMTRGDETLSIRANCAVQGCFAFFALLLWQAIYTRPRFDELILQPMEANHTSYMKAMCILLSFTLANLIHALSFFHTLKHFWGGSTSAGVMKGLQAVLVFVFTSLAYCGRLGGSEMCFSKFKFISLVTVVGGVVLFGKATERAMNAKAGYIRVENRDEVVV
jgi:drug/metabolite transporter (DMT)-like permease